MHVCSVSVYSVLGEEEHTPALSTLTRLSSKLTTALQVRYSGLFSAACNKILPISSTVHPWKALFPMLRHKQSLRAHFH